MVTASCKTLSWQPGIQLFFEFFPEDFQSRFALFEQEHFDFIDEFGGAPGKGIVPRPRQCPIAGVPVGSRTRRIAAGPASCPWQQPAGITLHDGLKLLGVERRLNQF